MTTGGPTAGPAGARSARAARALLAAVVVLAGMVLHGLDAPGVSVSIRMATTLAGKGEVFYARRGEGYSQARSVRFQPVPDGHRHRYEARLPATYRTERIRIDPGSGPGRIRVEEVSVRNGRHALDIRGDALRDALGITHDVRRAANGEALAFDSTGKDPYLELVLAKGFGGRTAADRLLVLGVAGTIAALAWWLLELALASLWRRLGLARVLDAAPGRVCRFIGDDALLRVDRRILLPFAAILVLAVGYVALGLNQSSLGWWENIYPARPVHQAIDLGTPKRIRMDEWSVQTPWVLNQVEAGTPLRNPNVGAEYAPLIASLPVPGFVGAAHLKFLGFRLFGAERGMSWWWAYKTFAVLASFLWLLLLLTRGNLSASLAGTAWIYASSFTQWWLSSNLPEILSAFAFGVVGAIYALFSVERRLIAIGCALVAYAAVTLVLNLYPPFIVPLGYLGVAILAGFALQRRGTGTFLRDLRFRSAAIALAAVAVGGYVLHFAGLASGSIDAMLHTVYPGQRVAGSGGVPLAKALYGYFESFRSGELHFPPMSTNASEASSFVLLFPLVLLALPARQLVRRGDALLAALLCACAAIACWVLLDLPAPVERVAQALGWSLVTPKRAVLALGIASIIASTVLFARMQEGRMPAYRADVRGMSIVVLLVGLLAFGWGLRQMAPDFFTWQVVLVGTVASTLLGAGIVTGRSALLVAGLAIHALPTLAVNPLVSGISALSEKPILVLAERHSTQPGTRWAVIGDPTLAQGLKAHGLSVLGGTQFLPEKRDFAVLDPAGRHERVWNRYATIGITSDPRRKSPRFTRKRGDQYWISLDVCSGKLQALGVDRIAYTVPVPRPDRACLAELPGVPDSGVALFRLLPGGTAR